MWSFMGAGTDQASLVSLLQKTGRVSSARVADVLKSVDRRFFVAPGTPKQQVYMDSPVPIGWSQTISAPHMHAAALDMLEGQLVPGARALDVGSGSGYLAAAMALLVGPGGRVLGVDKHAPLVERSRAAVAAALPPAAAALVTLINANALGGDDDALGGPFDAIHVGAAADHLPASLVAALAPGGRLIIPVGPDVTGPGAAVGGGQVLKVVDKSPDGRSVSEEDVMGVRFVPLTAPGVDREGGL